MGQAPTEDELFEMVRGMNSSDADVALYESLCNKKGGSCKSFWKRYGQKAKKEEKEDYEE